ncbi:MAG: hypothetical protein HY738_01895 [Bacteroidia bacterium]|nr:hypothetical protein [Bacteroidia bacterium]
MENKEKSKYPLYPKYGIHWSFYSLGIVADSILTYIEKLRQIDMPNYFWTKVTMNEPIGDDYDIADGMNLLFRLTGDELAYPDLQMESDSGKAKPSVIIIADSYYWGMFNYGISNAFSDSHFWYYNNMVYPDSYLNPVEVSQLNLKNEIEKHDVFIIMATEATLPYLGWGFIENVYELFRQGTSKPLHNAEFGEKIKNIINYIKTDTKWMEQIAKKAVINKISIDSMLTLDAIWLIQQENN